MTSARSNGWPAEYGFERCRFEQAQAVINVPHFRRAVLFVINRDFAVVENNVAGVVAAFVAINRHAAELAAVPEKFRDGTVFHRQIRIAVEHEKFIAEQRQRAFDGATRAQQFRAVERIIESARRTRRRRQNRVGSFRRDSRRTTRRGGCRGHGAIRADAPETVCPRRARAIWEFFP